MRSYNHSHTDLSHPCPLPTAAKTAVIRTIPNTFTFKKENEEEGDEENELRAKIRQLRHVKKREEEDRDRRFVRGRGMM